MDGKNSSGRRVSLLNDGPEAPTLVRLPSTTSSLRSRTSSYTSSPIGSPAIPRFVRSDSSDSVTMQTPSPITPEFAPFDGQMPGMSSPYNAQQQYFDMPQNGMSHNGLPHNDMKSENFEYQQPHILGPMFTQQTYYRPQMSEQHIAAPPPAPVNARPKKNSYPCPMAKQYGCSDYFTTSGHAARHAKKHTGRKDAFCPECNKAFTRKDNMEKHRRIHQTGRNAKNGSDSGVKKTKPAPKRPRPSPIQSSAQVPAADMYDPALPMSPDSTAAFMAPAVQHADLSPRQPMYPDPTHYSMSHGYSIGSSSSGLDVLAVAASDEKRKFE